MVTRRRLGVSLAAALALFATGCSRDPAEAPDAAPPRAVPGLETVVATTAPVRDAVRLAGVVAPDGLTPEARDARSELAAAEARARLAAQQSTRLRALAPGDVSPRKDLEAALAEEASARAAVERARQVVAALGGAPDALPLDATTVFVVARVPQESIGLVAQGAPATFVADAAGQPTLAGTDEAAPAYVDAASRTAPARVRVADPAHRTLPGLTGTVTIEIGTTHDAVVVPEAAVVYDDRRPLVFVDDGHGRFTETAVTLGIVRDGRAEITTGVAPGARVATVGAASLLSQARLASGPTDAD